MAGPLGDTRTTEPALIKPPPQAAIHALPHAIGHAQKTLITSRRSSKRTARNTRTRSPTTTPTPGPTRSATRAPPNPHRQAAIQALRYTFGHAEKTPTARPATRFATDAPTGVRRTSRCPGRGRDGLAPDGRGYALAPTGPACVAAVSARRSRDQIGRRERPGGNGGRPPAF
ncbi:hypothetical protein GCM10022416_11590 [Actinomadura keratinilytica]|uniref:Uncharacterized protein n=1 Tax=Actinomadura keratinilytica TaxID=547461 RepID=A0ABP7Y857_9ACTN